MDPMSYLGLTNRETADTMSAIARAAEEIRSRERYDLAVQIAKIMGG